MNQPLYAGVELGGTKCVCILARSHEEVLDKRVVDTTEPEQTVGEIERILTGWHANEPIRSLGIASFGPIDLNRASPSWGFITTTTKRALVRHRRGAEASTSARQSRRQFDTDVNGAALAELHWGAGQSLTDLAYVTVGHGRRRRTDCQWRADTRLWPSRAWPYACRAQAR